MQPEAPAMSDYETDLVTWADRQAVLLRRMAAGECVNDQVDWQNVAEEIEALGRSDRRELRNRVRTILVHLIKLQTSPASDPRAGWCETVLEQRSIVAELLDDSPSLMPLVEPAITRELPAARAQAAAALAAHRETPHADPVAMTFTVDQVLGPWLPN